jgi:hypothetical protein
VSPKTKLPPEAPDRKALDAAVDACLQSTQELVSTIYAIREIDLDKHEQPWRVVENTLALAGALANLLHQIYSKRPNVNAPVADIVTEPRPPAPTTPTEQTK